MTTTTNERQPARMNPTRWTMAFGTVIFLATLGAWLYGESHAIDTNILWGVSTPLVMALFVGHQIGELGDAARAAANQTNGSLDARLKNAVNEALATDAARRTQPDTPPPTRAWDN